VPFCKPRQVVGAHFISLCVGNEGDDVAVGVGDVEVGSAPGLSGRSLGDRGSSGPELLEKGLHVVSLDAGADKRFLPGGGQVEHEFMHEAQVQAGAVTRHGPIERRRAVEKVDLEAQLLPKEIGARRHIAHQQDRDGGLQRGSGSYAIGVQDWHGFIPAGGSRC
jgi:hypothetical protein